MEQIALDLESKRLSSGDPHHPLPLGKDDSATWGSHTSD